MERATLGSLVWSLSTRWRTAVDRAVAPLGLTHAQYSALAMLAAMQRRGGAPTQRDLAERMGLTAIYVSKLLRALELGGTVQRNPDPADSRALRLSLTAEGAARLKTARAAVLALDSRLTEPLGDPDGPAAQAFRITLRSLLTHHATLHREPGETP